jgi:UDPglucose 6-dehydrogenase
MADISRRHGYEFQIMEAVLRVNDAVKMRMIDKIVEAVGGDVKGKTIGVLGLAFKPETDDMRDSPAIPIIQGLQARGSRIRAYDPQAMENAKQFFEDIEYCRDAYATAEGSDALVLATEWNVFRALDFDRVKKALRTPVLVDLRNVYDVNRMRALGFSYTSVGRAEDVRTKEN